MNEQIYHITTKEEWETAKVVGEYSPANFEKEGFIHCSYPHQVVGVADFIFEGQENLMLLSIKRSLIECEVKDENLEGGQELFPHVYGALPVQAVSEVMPFPCNADGKFDLPDKLKIQLDAK